MATDTRRYGLQTIADPTRWQIIDRLTRQSRNVNALAERFASSRSAVSQQLKILTECGPVVVRRQGTGKRVQSKAEHPGRGIGLVGAIP